MSYTPLPASAVDAASPWDETIATLIKADLDDHEARIKSVEDPSTRIFSHFAQNAMSGGGLTGAATLDQYLQGLRLNASAGVAWKEGAYYTAGDHRLIFVVNSTSTSPTTGLVHGHMDFRFDQVTAPATFRARVKFVAFNNLDRMELGFGGRGDGTDIVNNASGQMVSGVFLEKSDATHWVFTAADNGTPTTGTPFANVADGTWTEVKIVWNSATEAKCYVDGALKETIVSGLPTTRRVNPFCRFFRSTNWGSSGDKVGIDRFEAFLGGQFADLA